jgi:hypothetical protein
MRRSFIVSLEMPKSVTVPEMKEYVESAVRVWKGQLHPDQPIFDLDADSVQVTPVKQRRRKK